MWIRNPLSVLLLLGSASLAICGGRIPRPRPMIPRLNTRCSYVDQAAVACDEARTSVLYCTPAWTWQTKKDCQPGRCIYSPDDDGSVNPADYWAHQRTHVPQCEGSSTNGTEAQISASHI